MYRIDKRYKIELKQKIFYTGIILEEDSTQIRVRTDRNEELVLSKEEIRQAKLIEQNGIEDDNDDG